MSRGRYRAPAAPGAIFAALFMLLVAWRIWQETQHTVNLPPKLEEQHYGVARVIDGDTLLLANDVRVRLIGVDTPETVKPEHPVEPWGPEATQFTRQFVASGQVRLQFDKERRDRYERYLAYVWVGDRLLNEELVLAGLARVELQYNYSPAMKTRFRRAEATAQSAHRGIWSQPADSQLLPAAAAGNARE
jgi:micrococcal nuclease